jgi:hypothetical protein
MFVPHVVIQNRQMDILRNLTGDELADIS